ncbi:MULTISPECIES: PaaI family thioesterase [unclassified Halomonas]|jgi:uncharacterized protein (TIGR00369 family)|uniref:PaaI family thioesterase n=1 Tax=unclassified Halomonas TaxID=2609666 RepID=UPI0011A802C4|nr:PaaI family thioesterase [Halomonas sp. C22]
MDLNVLHNPFIDMLGAQLVEWQPGQCTWQLALAAHHTNTQGSLHGGVIATLLDVACGYTGFCPENGQLPHRAATLSLTVQYIAKVNQGTLVAKGRLQGGGQRVFFADAQLLAGDRLIATASGTFRRHRVSPEEAVITAS